MSILFTPVRIGNVEIKNRFVRSPAGDKRAAPDGKCTEGLIQFYEDLAEGGSGLIITGAAFVHPKGCGLPNMIGMHSDEVIDGYRTLTDEVHARNSKIFVQIWHCGRHVTPTYQFGIPLAPSAVRDKVTGIVPREMTEDDIREAIECFGQASRRVKDSGFDGVEFHGAHGYLIHEFLSPYTNRRTDRWGGSFENRIRFVVECYERARALVGEDFPIAIKMNANDYVDGGITIDLSKEIAARISAIGFDAIEISAGVRDERHFNMSRGDIPKSYFGLKGKSPELRREIMEHLERIKHEVKYEEAYLRPFAKEFKKVIGVPLIMPGGLKHVSVMEDVIARGDADFVGLCRPLIRDPDFPNKVRDRGLSASDCMFCNQCLVDKPVMCYQKVFRPPHL